MLPIANSLLKQFKISKQFKDHQKVINSLDIDDTGKYLLTSGQDECIKIYDISSGKLLHTVNSKKYGCTFIQLIYFIFTMH